MPPAVAPSLPLPSVEFAWLCGDGDSGNPAAPEAGPQRGTGRQAPQADCSPARAPARGEWGEALAGAPSHMLLGGRGTPAFQTLPLESGMENLRSIDNDRHIRGVALSLRNPHTACSFELTATQLSLRGGELSPHFANKDIEAQEGKMTCPRQCGQSKRQWGTGVQPACSQPERSFPPAQPVPGSRIPTLCTWHRENSWGFFRPGPLLRPSLCCP